MPLINMIIYAIIIIAVVAIIISMKKHDSKSQVCYKKQNAKFLSLGTLVGKSYDEIVAVCGIPAEESGNCKAWYDFFYLITLSFDENNICTGIVEQRTANSTPRSNYVLLRVFLIVIMIGAGAIFTVFNSIGNPFSSSYSKVEMKDNYGHDKFDAHVIAEKVVSEQLKSPSTAKFSKTSECTISVDGNTWTVSGWVDAQNSFGATLRNNYTVKITFSGREKYTVDKCIIN